MTTLVTRPEWGARPPRSMPARITPSHLTAHYGGPSPWPAPGVFDHARCASVVRAWQAYHMDRNGWSDIAYSSLVCPHGYRYEGRGPGARTAANGTNTANGASLATCYIAGEGDPLTAEAQAGFRAEAARFAVPLDRVHSDWFATACPGAPVRNWVKSGASTAPQQTKPPVAPPIAQPTIEEDAVRLVRNDITGDRGRGQVWALWSDRTRTPVSADHYPHLKAYAEASGGSHTNIGNAPAWSVLMQTWRAA